MKHALFYKKLENNKVRCNLCPHFCKINEGEVGICGVRKNSYGHLYSLVYEKAIAMHADPIEKKPLFHVYPGSRSFSVATMGCNFKCTFCQNHEISQVTPDSNSIMGQEISANDVVRIAKEKNCKTIACTYTEPTIYYEYALDIAKAAMKENMDTVWVTNGFISEEPLREIAPYLTGANVDLKGWDEEFYKDVIGGSLKRVLKALKLMKKLGIWVEVTTLMVPGYVEQEKDIRSVASFIANELGPETPWHISRFYPQYQCTHLPPTSMSVIRKAVEIGRKSKLRYVYSGNAPGDDGENTYCYSCHEKLIERYGFEIMKNKIQNGKCHVCGAEIQGVGM